MGKEAANGSCGLCVVGCENREELCEDGASGYAGVPPAPTAVLVVS